MKLECNLSVEILASFKHCLILTSPWTKFFLRLQKIQQILSVKRGSFSFGERGWRSGESTRLPPVWPGFKSRRRCHMWVEFVVASLLCSKRFFSGYSGFLLSSQTNMPQFEFDQESCRRRSTMWMCYLQIVIY